MWLEIRVPDDAGGAPTHWRATLDVGAVGTAELPTTELHVVVRTPAGRVPQGHIVLAPPGIDAFLLVADWAAGRRTEQELTQLGAIPLTYDGDRPLTFPKRVRGRRYAVGILPREGKGLSTSIGIRGAAEQWETESVP
jgi:hypothetical protein